MVSRLLYTVTILVAAIAVATSFTPSIQSSKSSILSLRATQEEAAALTDFMAKAHEEKIRAMERVEAKYKDKIAELEQKVQELEGPSTASGGATSPNSYAFPATNKNLTEKVRAYQEFISKYIIKAQAEKQKAVKDAENKVTAKYEAIIEAMDQEAP